jgi:cytidyltransferase-like protein
MDHDDTKARSQWLDPIVIVSGGFDPIHKGHTELFKAASEWGEVHVLLNSDEWLSRKKGAPFLTFDERKEILSYISIIHEIHEVDDRDNTVSKGLLALREKYPNRKMFFANGGDRTIGSTPEMWFCEDLDIKMFWGAGGGKVQSSSALLNKYANSLATAEKEGVLIKRSWGHYEILSSGEGWLTKLLTINPGKNISLQKHKYRSEEWLILEGYGYYADSEQHHYASLAYPGLKIEILPDTWHWVKNKESTMPLRILETWFGEELKESDIERKEDESEIIIFK